MEGTSHGGDLGVTVIDRDHQFISELLLEINFNAAREGDPRRQIRRLNELAHLTRSHFLLEEGMMTAAQYPGLTLHTLRHEWMMEQIRRLAAYWSGQRNAMTREPMGLLWESHTAHMECEDRAFGLWLDAMNLDAMNGERIRG
jgi:hemerythrin-like metal-binding protein